MKYAVHRYHWLIGYVVVGAGMCFYLSLIGFYADLSNGDEMLRLVAVVFWSVARSFIETKEK